MQHLALPAVKAAEWIYRPTQDGFTDLSNDTERDLVVYVQETCQQLTLQPGQSGQLKVPPGTKVNVLFNYLGLWGLTSRRTRLASKAFVGGESFGIKEPVE